MSTYKKPHLSLQAQLDLLKSRGLEVSDDVAALSNLSRIGYYRLSGYLYPFRRISVAQNDITREDIFRVNSKFEHALKLYVFDKRLRLLILDAIERIEVGFRVDISHLLGSKDPFAHTKPEFLHGNFTKKTDKGLGKTGHQVWLEKYNQILARSKEEFFVHFKKKYGLPLPIWVSVELWDFGMLSVFYKGMNVIDKKIIATKYGLSGLEIEDFKILESWLRTLNFVRNVAAHHSRLWNKNIIDQPKLPISLGFREGGEFMSHEIHTRIYGVLCILLHLMRVSSPNSSWPTRLRELIKDFPSIQFISLFDMGFPEGWEKHEIWR